MTKASHNTGDSILLAASKTLKASKIFSDIFGYTTYFPFTSDHINAAHNILASLSQNTENQLFLSDKMSYKRQGKVFQKINQAYEVSPVKRSPYHFEIIPHIN